MEDHPFEVGGRYRNEKGDYEVLAVESERMQIRFDDGTEQSVKIAIQARIWERMQEKTIPPPEQYDPSRESQAIQPVVDLVVEVLRSEFKVPYPEDITDQVCLAIEQNPEWLGRYENLVLHYSQGGKKGKDIVNSSIGFYTKDLTGMVNMGEGQTAKSKLIQSYSKLGYPPS